MTQRIIAALIFAIALPASAKVEFNATQLMLINSEQVQDLVQKKIKKASEAQAAAQSDDDDVVSLRVDPDAVESLKDGMRIALSRPERVQDGARGVLFTRLRRELLDLNSHETVLKALATEAISALKAKSDGPKIQATYVFLLHNMMDEIKPEVGSNATYKQIVEQIRDAQIEIPENIKTQQFLGPMNNLRSPSLAAASILPKTTTK